MSNCFGNGTDLSLIAATDASHAVLSLRLFSLVNPPKLINFDKCHQHLVDILRSKQYFMMLSFPKSNQQDETRVYTSEVLKDRLKLISRVSFKLKPRQLV